MDITQQVIGTLHTVLNPGGRPMKLDPSTPLLGAVPELDSMAVLSLLTSLEERFGITIDDDEVDGQVFATVGTLVAFVEAKLAS